VADVRRRAVREAYYNGSVMRRYGLSKSRIIIGLQCVKRLWLAVHRPELAEVSAQTERLWAGGHRVGEVARSLHPGGVLIEAFSDLRHAKAETRTALAQPGDKVLFEPAFDYGGVVVRADLLFAGPGGNRLVEVKASTAVKDYHLNDAAVQAWVITRSGLDLDAVAVAHIDSQFVYQGDGDYCGLFREVDVGGRIQPVMKQIPVWITDFRQALAGPLPAIEVGPQCHSPFDCPFLGHCAPHTESASCAELPRLDSAAHEMALSLGYPRAYLDFEAIAFGVPIWAGTRPYEQLPFQWSLHVERADGALDHGEFLDTTGEPPMRAVAESLVAALADAGAAGPQAPVLTYGTYERSILQGLAQRFPDLGPALLSIADRLVDLLACTRRWYSHPAMHGSWSLKAVLPTVAPDLDYASLADVRDGGAAQDAYLQLIDGDVQDEQSAAAQAPELTEARRAALRTALLAYCAQDTLALVRLVHFFAESG
jgi:hypothetical protein